MLRKLLDEFLAERHESDQGSWAPVNNEDVDNLNHIISTIIEQKWAADQDGDRPIDVTIIDRTKYEPLHHFALPYLYKIEDSDSLDEYTRRAFHNVSCAMEALERAMKMKQNLKSKKDNAKS